MTDEMRDASEEAAESLEEKLEEKPEGITDHEWLLRREKSGEHLAACDRAFRCCVIPLLMLYPYL